MQTIPKDLARSCAIRAIERNARRKYSGEGDRIHAFIESYDHFLEKEVKREQLIAANQLLNTVDVSD